MQESELSEIIPLTCTSWSFHCGAVGSAAVSVEHWDLSFILAQHSGLRTQHCCGNCSLDLIPDLGTPYATVWQKKKKKKKRYIWYAPRLSGASTLFSFTLKPLGVHSWGCYSGWWLDGCSMLPRPRRQLVQMSSPWGHFPYDTNSECSSLQNH